MLFFFFFLKEESVVAAAATQSEPGDELAEACVLHRTVAARVYDRGRTAKNNEQVENKMLPHNVIYTVKNSALTLLHALYLV